MLQLYSCMKYTNIEVVSKLVTSHLFISENIYSKELVPVQNTICSQNAKPLKLEESHSFIKDIFSSLISYIFKNFSSLPTITKWMKDGIKYLLFLTCLFYKGPGVQNVKRHVRNCKRKTVEAINLSLGW